MSRIKVFLAFLIISLTLSSCWKNVQFEKIHNISDGVWQEHDTVSFEFEIPDSSITYNLLYDFRYTINYNYENLYLTYAIKDSTGKLLEQNLQLVGLFHPKTGKPFGSSIGDTYDYRIIGVPGFKFPYSGKFTMHLIQQMRIEELKGIEGVGLRIEKNNPAQ